MLHEPAESSEIPEDATSEVSTFMDSLIFRDLAFLFGWNRIYGIGLRALGHHRNARRFWRYSCAVASAVCGPVYQVLGCQYTIV